MSEFTASNGRVIRRSEKPVAGGSHVSLVFGASGHDGTFTMTGPQEDALREFFRAEEDKRLGRWRSTIDAAWTAVVQADSGYVVFRHDDGERGFSVAPDQSNMPSWTRELQEVAREYFDAHPEPKPWRDAKDGEIWALTIGPNTDAYEYDASNAYFVRVSSHGTRGISMASFGVTDGRRIWPEVAS